MLLEAGRKTGSERARGGVDAQGWVSQAEGAKMAADVVVKDYSGGGDATIAPMQEEDDEALNQPGLKIFGKCRATVGYGTVQLIAVQCGAGSWALTEALGLPLVQEGENWDWNGGSACSLLMRVVL
ncbi:hypothetical protein FGRMN_8536 [Fusarium graminum]|nr:hypothetical protein FGRMN_8536 [Fusarium graminum]